MKGLQFWEVDADDLPMPFSLKGQLRATIAFRRYFLHASPTVLGVIESGYVLPLTSEPSLFHGKNQASAFESAQFVSECIAELVSGGCVRELETAPVIAVPS